MKAALTRLRIAGFKSFAEPVSLDILPGLTGIVGPNGCGKSNVVEALRWAMGETSARSLRGGDMDDVIFAGTVARPSRNLAEVTLTLEGELPEPHAAEAELAVTRRIERGAGSSFRANGRELRARDIQTLYADLASGARSSGMVSQGRISALVTAKPEERRQVLEEAAGITGLHARRHEAELKLRATEQNLARAEDVRIQLEAAGEALRKQAKAAARYRNISGLIRAAEAEHLAILRGQSEAECARAATTFEAAAEAAASAMRAAEQAAVALAEAEAAVPGPRAEEAACRSRLERRRLESETLAAEAQRAADALADAQSRRREIEADLADAVRVRDEAAAVSARLAAERSALDDRLRSLPAALADAESKDAAASDAETAAAAALDAAAERATHAAAASRQADYAADQAADALEAASRRLAECRDVHEALLARRLDPATVADADRRAAAAAEAVRLARDALDHADEALAGSNTTVSAARAAWQQAASEHRSAAERLADARRRKSATAATLDDLLAAAAELEASRIEPESVERAMSAAAAAAEAAEAAEQAAGLAGHAAREADSAQLAASATAAANHAAHARAAAEAAAATRRRDALAEEADAQRERIAAAAASLPDPRDLEQAEAAASEAAARLAGCHARLQTSTAHRLDAEEQLAAARAAAAAAAAELLRHTAEAAGLRAALGETMTGDFPPASDLLSVPPGLEAAAAAALGEAAGFALDPAATQHWAMLPALPAPPVPAGTASLDRLVGAPEPLARALAHALLIGDVVDGARLQASLQPGQVAVNRSGDAWRWDGQVTRAAAQSKAAARLQQRNRLQTVEHAAHAAAASAAATGQQAAAAEAAASAARAEESAARADATTAASHAQAASAARDRRAAAAAEARARYESLLPGLARLKELQRAAEADLAQQREAVRALPDPAQDRAIRAEAETRLAAARAVLEAATQRHRQARAAAVQSQDEARRLAAAAAAAAQRAALLAPQLARAQQEDAAAAAFLQQAETRLTDAPAPAELEARFEAAERSMSDAAARAAAARAARRAAEQELVDASAHVGQLAATHQQVESALAAQITLLDQAAREHSSAIAAEAAAAAAAAALPDAVALAEAAATARTSLVASRQHCIQTAALVQSLRTEATQAASQKAAIAAEHASWQTRLADASRRCDQLASRADAATPLCQTLAAAPDDIGRRARDVAASLAAAEQAHADAGAALATAEERVRAAASHQRQADAAEAACRAGLARAEAARDAAAGALAAVRARVAERFPDQPAALPAVSDLSDAAEERARRRAERLTREREDMGPVNLRADIELGDIEQKAADLEREREELATAIARLRGAIGHLNREGRARLSEVFAEVDRHFRTLFTRMMGGGRAHLALTGADDPLLAGLEIYAEPPGKKLSTLSLLSGGEQALTALSLIFAVFRCNPAPVSVLDEVDAPLDDANVERFCTLLDEMVRDTGTRFLVVTHHQVTMSRMDRLFGVTMQERGVSRLLSVDLQRAAALVAEPALQAAE